MEHAISCRSCSDAIGGGIPVVINLFNNNLDNFPISSTACCSTNVSGQLDTTNDAPNKYDVTK
jgi:hypothetical protein